MIPMKEKRCFAEDSKDDTLGVLESLARSQANKVIAPRLVPTAFVDHPVTGREVKHRRGTLRRGSE